MRNFYPDLEQSNERKLKALYAVLLSSVTANAGVCDQGEGFALFRN